MRPDRWMQEKGKRLNWIKVFVGFGLLGGLWGTVGASAPASADKARAKAAQPPAHKAKATKAKTGAQRPAPPKRENHSRGPAFGHTPEVRSLAQALAQSHQLPAAWVEAQLSQARFLPGVPQLVLPPSVPTQKNWYAYQARFIEPRRIEAGLQFWREHAQALARAEAQYGVPAEIVVGIIGVETFYGRHMGQHRVLDALTTLSLRFPSAHPRAEERRKFFVGELGAFLQNLQRASAKSEHFKGSFAGAMGWPQFMPSSQQKFAVDFDGDGRIDLIDSPVDAIGSVANYFQAFGWRTGQPTHYSLRFDASRLNLPELLAPDILPTFSAQRLRELGVELPEEAQQHTGPMALIELFNGNDDPSYVIGTENFYTITRYNWSSYYAMAVIELAQAVKARASELQVQR